MASNISCFVDSLKNQQFIPGREQEEALRPTVREGAEKHLMGMLNEPCGDVG